REEPGPQHGRVCLGVPGARAAACGERGAYGAHAKSGHPCSSSDAGTDAAPRRVAAVGVTEPRRRADFHGAARTAAEADRGGAMARAGESGDPAADAWRRQPAAAGSVIRRPVAGGAWTIAALAAAFIHLNPYVQELHRLSVLNAYLPYWWTRLPLTVVFV